MLLLFAIRLFNFNKQCYIIRNNFDQNYFFKKSHMFVLGVSNAPNLQAYTDHEKNLNS